MNEFDPNDETSMRWQKSRVVTALGGMAAMEQKFGLSGSVSCKDLSGAASTLRSMVENEGIAGFGFIGYGYKNSEELDHLQEVAISALLNQYYLKAKEILAGNPELMSKVTDKLINDGVITMEDIAVLRYSTEINSVELG